MSRFAAARAGHSDGDAISKGPADETRPPRRVRRPRRATDGPPTPTDGGRTGGAPTGGGGTDGRSEGRKVGKSDCGMQTGGSGKQGRGRGWFLVLKLCPDRPSVVVYASRLPYSVDKSEELAIALLSMHLN